MANKSEIGNPKPSMSFWHPASLICTCFGVGQISFAPGTWGSLFGAIIGYYSLTNSLVLALFALGWFCSNIYENKFGTHDSKEIVIDEVVGVLLAISINSYLCFVFFNGLQYFVPYGIDNAKILILLTAYLVPFLTFRFFDILKPGPIGWIDRNVKGGLGVMLDDVAAGVAAGITSALIFWLWTVI